MGMLGIVSFALVCTWIRSIWTVPMLWWKRQMPVFGGEMAKGQFFSTRRNKYHSYGIWRGQNPDCFDIKIQIRKICDTQAITPQPCTHHTQYLHHLLSLFRYPKSLDVWALSASVSWIASSSSRFAMGKSEGTTSKLSKKTMLVPLSVVQFLRGRCRPCGRIPPRQFRGWGPWRVQAEVYRTTRHKHVNQNGDTTSHWLHGHKFGSFGNLIFRSLTLAEKMTSLRTGQTESRGTNLFSTGRDILQYWQKIHTLI